MRSPGGGATGAEREDPIERRNRKVRSLLLAVMAFLGGGTIIYVAFFAGS